MSLWIFFSITALTIKSLLLFSKTVRKERFLCGFVSFFFLLNLLEFSSFFLLNLGFNLFILKLYYALTVFCVFYLLLLASYVSQHTIKLRTWKSYCALVLFSIVIMLSNDILTGTKPLPNGSITRIAGEYYFIFQLYIISMLLLTFGLLLHRIIKTEKYLQKSRCLMTLLSFLPSTLVIFFIMLLMQLGYSVNMLGALSLANCFMLLTYIPLSSEHNLRKVMKFVPFTREHRNRVKQAKLTKIGTACAFGEASLEEFKQEIKLLALDAANIYRDAPNKLTMKDIIVNDE